VRGARRLGEVVTHSEAETVRLGEALGRELRAGDVVGLVGPLGSGKTYFTKGLARGLGVGPGEIVRSPTFALINEYRGRLAVYHFDAYRFTNPAELEALGAFEIFGGENVSIVEWADRVAEAMPEAHLRIEFAHAGPTKRRIAATSLGPMREIQWPPGVVTNGSES
jgi:tRNA threonylcarbamoyladenosine biosynthesis protein TsaE